MSHYWVRDIFHTKKVRALIITFAQGGLAPYDVFLHQ